VQLVRFDGEQPGWALVDEDGGLLRHVAGELTAWAPRIAGGEGFCALPLTGRTRPAAEPLLSLRPLLNRILQLPGSSPPAAPRLAAVVGAPLAGRRNPFRSIFGYVLLDGEQGCRTVVTRDEFGDQPPGLSGDPASWAGRLLALDGAFGLRPADVVVLGRADVDDHLTARLSAANLAASRRRETRRAAWMRRPEELAAPGLAYPGQAGANRPAAPAVEA
jgi:hypothetical protein